MPTSASFHAGELTVSDIMADLPASVPRETSLSEVAGLLADSDYRYVIITNSDGTLAGVVSGDDLLRKISKSTTHDDGEWKTKTVESVMNTKFIASSPDARADDIAPLITGASIECVPVMEGDSLVGVLTRDDLLMSWNRIAPVLHGSTIDPVTNLANRATFNQRLDEEWERSERQAAALCLILVDVDYFKKVNDSCGHMAGDAILRAVGSCLVRHMRHYDVVARFGGDEFAAICCDCDSSKVDVPISRLQQAVRSMSVPSELGRRGVTLSIGAALIEGPRAAWTAVDLIELADACLYESKAHGRDCAFRAELGGKTAPNGDPEKTLVEAESALN